MHNYCKKDEWLEGTNIRHSCVPNFRPFSIKFVLVSIFANKKRLYGHIECHDYNILVPLVSSVSSTLCLCWVWCQHRLLFYPCKHNFFYYYFLGISFLARVVVFLASHFSQRFLYWLSSKIFKPKTVLALIVNLKLASSFKHLASTYLGILLRCLGRSLSAFLYDNLFLFLLFFEMLSLKSSLCIVYVQVQCSCTIIHTCRLDLNYLQIRWNTIPHDFWVHCWQKLFHHQRSMGHAVLERAYRQLKEYRANMTKGMADNLNVYEMYS